MDNLNYLFNLPVGKHKLGNQEFVYVSIDGGEKNYLIKTNHGSLILTLYKKHGQIGRKIGLRNNDAERIINTAVRLHKKPQRMYTCFELAFLWSIVCILVSIIATLTNPQNFPVVLLSLAAFVVTLTYLKGHKND